MEHEKERAHGGGTIMPTRKTTGGDYDDLAYDPLGAAPSPPLRQDRVVDPVSLEHEF
jgi:hypothetical protein